MEDDVFKEDISKEDFAEEELSRDNSKESVVKGIVSKEDFSKTTSKEEFSKDALAESRSKSSFTYETYDVDMAAFILVDMIVSRISLSNLTKDMIASLKSKSKKPLIESFVFDPAIRMIAFMVDLNSEITIHYSMPLEANKEIFFFLKNEGVGGPLKIESFNRDLTYGSASGKHLDSMLRVMSGVFIPAFFRNSSWPDSIKNEFTSKMQRFMARLSDSKWKSEDKTVLYIPLEAVLTSVESASKNKEMIQRLEMVIIHWTRQIKEVLSSQDTFQLSEGSGPLEEIQFWSNRCDDLSGITLQLDKPGVKKVNNILQNVKSSYVAPFSTLSTLIKEGSLQAQSNLKFLMVLKAPCQELSNMIPSKIPEILPKVLKLIRMIWMHSEFYNTKERVAGLLRKLSNEVINRCIAAINLDKVFGGFVESSKNTLNECINCCESWKIIYKKISQTHTKYSGIPWTLDQTGIFAQIDAFIQRCRDLVEVCDCQYHFCRAHKGDKLALPVFKGQRGSEILRGYLEIETIFERNLNALIVVKKTILDVKAMSWLDDFSKFRSGMKDLEVMMQNLIMSAFDTVITVEDGVNILEVFMHAAVREGIKRTVEKKTTTVFELFINLMNSVKKEMAQKPGYLLPWQPKYGGQSLGVKLMKKGLERTIALLARARFLPQVALSGEIRGIYSLLFHSMDEFIMKNFYEWTSELAKDPYKLLDIPLLKRNVEKGLIDINYTESLLKSFREVDYWERLSQELPHYIYDTSSRREAYRIQLENMLLVVKEYNRIILLLSPEERGLFRERIMFLDRKLLPGLTKITWSQTQVAEQFQYECRANISKVQTQLDNYKMANMEIVDLCLKLSESLLIKINQKRVYEEFEYQFDSTQHCKNVLAKLLSKHQEIIKIMLRTYEFFRNDGNEVQQYWFGYTMKMDMLVEEALRWNIKWSLQEISKAIIGDGKAGQSPMFKINILLKAVNGKENVCFYPQLSELSAMIYDSINMCFDSLKKFERLPDLLARKTKKDSISTAVSKDADVIKIQKSVAAGIQGGINSLMQYLATWDVYKEIWEVDKTKFIQNYKSLNPTSVTFDSDVFRYSELSLSVQMQESIVSVQFVMVDASNLKMSILAHCQEWQNKLLKLLFEQAYAHLTFLYRYIDESKAKLSTVPQTLKQLEEVLPVWDKLSNERKEIEKTFPELHNQFSVLAKYEVEIDDDVLLQLKMLTQTWNDYGHELEDSEFALKKIKEKFKASLLAQAEELRKLITACVEDFHTKGPFTGSTPLNEALSLIEHYKDQNNQLREQEINLKKGLMLFKLDQPPSKELNKMEHELDLLEEVWQLARQWDGYWNSWKYLKFVNLKIREIDDLSSTISKKIVKYSKELKTYNWSVIEDEKKKVMALRSIIPIIVNLNNTALRPRHWNLIQNEVGRTFDYRSGEFTLEKIAEWEFVSYTDLIAEISQSATNEIAIEQGLAQISATWEIIEFEFIPFKDKDLYKIKFSEEIPVTLDDNQSKLSVMKSSKYVISFLAEVDMWEKVLSIIMETMEMLTQVQKLWMYLENIFSGEEIRRQQSNETIYFEDIDSKWKSLIHELQRIKNVYRACHTQGLLELLKKMFERLEYIMNSIDVFLETKRLVFPRFYFISNNDLMEILGLSKNPIEMQYHMRKCFSNIKTLTFTKVGPSQRWEATHMNSSDGESVMFVNSVSLEGPVENWMADLEKVMKVTMREELKKCKTNLRKHLNKRDKWIKEHPGQACVLASQMQWTADVTRGLIVSKEHGDKKALKSLKKRHVILLNKYSEVIRSSLSKVQRLKTQTLITIEIHARDVLERLVKSNFIDPQSFEWHKELRTYWDRDLSECIIKQTTAQFQYGYEYLGNNGRLVVTPITERCYITLTTALFKHKGGSPRGLTGSGKTETVKDLGKALGVYVVVVNCSENVDFKSMSRTFSGLAQAGVWGCFDEFNRMSIEVLSVVAQQVFSILSALASGFQKFTFEGQEIKLEPLCGIFATMNIGCFGCTELPDNLKAMFRPISLTAPDTGMIAEVILYVEGFSNTKVFAKKLFTLHSLAQQQLSRQEHYDFGLRTLLSVLKYAGKKRRLLPNLSDEEILVYSVNEMIHAKLVSADLPLFRGITSDLFPGVEIPILENLKFKAAVDLQILLMGLQPIKYLEAKVSQIYETMNASQVGMLVGNTMSGKTTAWKVLQASCCALAKEGETGFQLVKPVCGCIQIFFEVESHLKKLVAYKIVQDYPINPKAFSISKLYGKYDLVKGKWSDGIVPSIMRSICSDEKLDDKWLIFDGPVDSLWTESMNSLIDDSKILTLTNGERITLSEQVIILFEVNDLVNSSPAIVSRCGVIYFECKELGWQPYVTSWLAKKNEKVIADELRALFDKFIPKTQQFKEANLCKDMTPMSELGAVVSLCNLFDILYSQMDSSDQESLSRLVELTFFFSLIWSLCASVDEDGRKKLDSFIREIEGTFPNKDSVYEYYIETKSKTWSHWEEKLKSGWKFTANLPFHKIIVPTIDVVRYSFLVEALLTNKIPVLLIGPRGGSKTVVAEDVINKLRSSNYNSFKINFSANISADTLQDLIESRLEKKMRGIYSPLMGKKMVLFIEDFSTPAKELYGGRPPLEFISFWINYGFLYDRMHQSRKYIKDVVMMAASDPAGGGRPSIIPRLQSKFHVISILLPQDSQIKRIFSTMLSHKLQDFEEDLKLLSEAFTVGSIEFHKAISAKLLPVPAKIHYTFNVKDISRVFAGLMRIKKSYHENKGILCRLWIHELFRVYHDRLICDKDREIFVNILTEKLGNIFDITYHNICKDKVPPIFSDLMNEDQIYEDHHNTQALREAMKECLEQYNNIPSSISMDLVLFNFAVENVTRITRAMGQPRGHMILVGIGGSGKRSLSRLATYICKYEILEVKISKSHKVKNFRKDLQKVYNVVGVENKKMVLLLGEAELMGSALMEDLDCLLTIGEVPNLIKYDNMLEEQLADSMRNEGIEVNRQTAIDYLIERAQNNLHVILCMSPVGEHLRKLIRTYPSLIRETTINWLGEWPHDALLDVAEKYFDAPEISKELEPKIRTNLVKMIAFMHTTAVSFAAKSIDELRMCAFVTPTNYFEFIECFKMLLQEKKEDIQSSEMKLKNGLWKIDDTKSKVEAMTIELVDAKRNVEKFQKQCEEYLASIVQQKREADEQAKSVAQKSEKIAEEELKCRKMAEVAQADLAEALPALEEAKKALEALNKKDITEIKSYGKPPLLVEKVLEAVMILRGNEPSWTEAKKQLGDQNFIKQLINLDLDNISDLCLKKVSGYCIQSDFQPEIVGRVSTAAKSLCMWVRAVEQYAKIYRVVEPKRHRLRVAETQLKEKMTLLQEAKNKLAEVEAKMAELKLIYDSNLQAKEEYRIKAEMMEIKLERASQLLDGLAGERERWSTTVQALEVQNELLVGNITLVSGFITYLGLFSGKTRKEIFTKTWIPEAQHLELPITLDLNPVHYLCDPTFVRDWILQGLPGDDFSTQNGLIMTKSRKWPLIIDPQGQAQKWIKNMESPKGLIIIDAQMSECLKTLEAAVQFGLPVMVENVLEEIEDSFDPLLKKSIKNRDGMSLMKLGDKEIKYTAGFRLYFTTKLSKPCFSPEIFSQTTIVNFAVTELGLQNQLLGVVIRKERPELEEQKDILVRSIASGKKKIKQLEDDILRLLTETEGSLLDDEQLLMTLQTSKSTSQEVHDSLETSEATEVQIDETREGYRMCAERASILFFVLTDMGIINNMYQFALDAYIDLFNLSIEKSHKSTKLEDRIIHLNDYHTYAVYRYACRALFEKHKLLFSFHMCAEVMRKAAKINAEEYNFFLQGGIVIDRDNQFDNPCSWLPSACWDNITELDKLANFHGLVTSFEQYQKDWNSWYISAEPENATLPGEWDISCNELQRILIVRSIRQDRVSFCTSSFITNNLGSRFVEPPILSFKSVLDESTCKTPLLFVLSPGVDPISDLVAVAEARGMIHRFHTLSLGQGQVPYATQLVLKGSKEGKWIFLANCHLSVKWMMILDKLVKDLQTAEPHPDFRLWLSSSPHPQFPISILQTGLKMTTEPPKGLKANMKRMYSRITDHQFSRCRHPEKYKKLLFSLIFFHSIVEERRKFLTLGWNVKYNFNDSDFEASESLLSLYLDEYEETPFEALKFLIAVINYGGQVIDEWDRRLLNVYIADYFCEEALASNLYKLSVLPTYYIPRDGSLNSYREYVSMLPNMDHPEAFGQHTNADITSQSQEAKMLFEALLSMEPSHSLYSGDQEDKVLELCESIKKQLPNNIDYATTEKIFIADKSLLKSVLLQEILMYNSLLDFIKEQLTSLENGIKGVIVMPSNLEELFRCIYEAQVPPAWMNWYPSMKPLASWTKDLIMRVEQLATWATTAHPPKIFWLSGFTYPTAFLTAVLQQSSRTNGIAIDLLSWEFTVMTVDDSNIASAPKDGVLVKGLYLQGAGWDVKSSCLIEAEPMQLICLLPSIHFKPVEAKRRTQKGVYTSPCYYCPDRGGTLGRASFVVAIDLRSGDKTPEHWTKRGTALLMSLDI